MLTKYFYHFCGRVVALFQKFVSFLLTFLIALLSGKGLCGIHTQVGKKQTWKSVISFWFQQVINV